MTPQNEQVSANTRNVYGMRHLYNLFFGSLSNHAACLALWLSRLKGHHDDICWWKPTYRGGNVFEIKFFTEPDRNGTVEGIRNPSLLTVIFFLRPFC